MMKKTLIATALMATSAVAQAEISGNVTLASDYVFRGISQTDNAPAIQGGFDYAHDSGFYLGTWASNVDSTFFTNSTDPQIELDLYGGYSGETGGGIGYDLGYLRYEYPGGGSNADTNEIYASLSYMGFTGSINYSDELNFVGSDESAYYLAAGYDMDLPMDFGLSLHLGYSDGDAFDSDEFGTDYTDWSIGVSKPVFGVDLGLTYTDTNLDDDECPSSNDDICDAIFTVSISKSL